MFSYHRITGQISRTCDSGQRYLKELNVNNFGNSRVYQKQAGIEVPKLHT